ncbi:DUF317 domain-containing protein [Streptomyces sp. NPDC085927]|uniref:DUF317 domain-containing protein n=1 Tax=Streptomyces sp. NPDC085927 TaxID=3365738 RepID=UPI0037D2C923
MNANEAPATVGIDLVSPPYPASSGDPAWVTVPLHRACGWSYGHDPLMPRVLLSSPDQKALLRLEPAEDGPWWTLQHARGTAQPNWYAGFGARTPVEIIATFTDALTDPAKPVGADPFEPLRQAGWHSPSVDDVLVSPDGIVRVDRPTYGGSNAWTIRTGLAWQPAIWRADLDGNTPIHLITALTSALASDGPLIRAPGRVPHLARAQMTVKSHSVPAESLASALEDRVRALSARRSITPMPTPTPRRPPAGPNRTR